MPTIRFGEHTVPCEAGVTLRDALRDAGLSPHNGRARFINCTGLALLSRAGGALPESGIDPANACSRRG